MARPSKKNQTTAGDVDAIGADDAGESADTPDIEEGKIFDYITGGPLKDTDKEQVRQRIARAIIHEYGIAAEDTEREDHEAVVEGDLLRWADQGRHDDAGGFVRAGAIVGVIGQGRGITRLIQPGLTALAVGLGR